MVRRWLGFRLVLLAMSVVLIAGWVPAANVQAQQGGTNLLVNGDFEWWDWNVRSWTLQDGIPEVQVCPGWRAFYVDNPPAKAKAPQYWRRPEFRDVKASEYPGRVRSGFLAAKYFSFAGQHEAGFYQQVGGIEPGTPLRFSAYMQLWSCMAAKEWNICPTDDKSNNPSRMHPRIGIDPTGGTDPWSPNVVWSPEIEVFDVWVYFQVEATAQNSTVTVFTYTWADWTEEIFRMNNDVYLDDASLIALNELPPTPTGAPAADTPTATPDPSQPTPTPGPTSTPAPTSTPRSDNAIVHVVQAGDTLGGIAARYQVTVEQLLQLNGLANANVVWVGQEIVISVPEPTATPTSEPTPTLALPTPTPVPPTPTALPPTPTAAPTATPEPPAATPSMTPTAAPAGKSGSGTAAAPWTNIAGIAVALAVGAGLGFGVGRTRR